MEKKEIVGISQHVESIQRRIIEASKTDLSVLVQGPTGTGKELIANNIHINSKRKDSPFIPLNCAALTETLLESELFGHEKGAFTGAVDIKKGRFELADGGTLFLDEAGEMPPSFQTKLLRVLQEKRFERVGGTKVVETDVRIICATNKDLLEEIKNGAFREDLYYRICQYNIHTIPLADRPEDLICLIDHFVRKKGKEVDPKVKFLLYCYNFPGNVRELENLIPKSYDHIVAELRRHFEANLGNFAQTPPVKPHSEYLFRDEDENYERQYNEWLKKCIEWDKNKTLEEALKLVTDEQLVFKKRIQAYEIVTLYQQTQLTKGQVAKKLRIRRQLLTPSKFRSTFGFEFPTKLDPCYLPSLLVNRFGLLKRKELPSYFEDQSHMGFKSTFP